MQSDLRFCGKEPDSQSRRNNLGRRYDMTLKACWTRLQKAYNTLRSRYISEKLSQKYVAVQLFIHTVSALRPLVLTWEFEVTQLTTVTLLCEWERAGTSFETFWVEMKIKIYMNQLSWVSTFCLPTGFGLWKTSRVNAEHFFGGQLSDLGSYPQVPHCTNLKAFTCTFQASAS